jgi:beta-glucosidase
VGAVVQEGLVELPLAQIENPVTGEPGARVRFLDAAGDELFVEDRRATALVWFGGSAPIGRTAVAELTTRWAPAETGEVRLGFVTVGVGRIFVDGEKVVDEHLTAVGDDLGAAILAPPSASAAIQVRAGVPVDVRFEFDVAASPSFLEGALALRLGTEPPATDADQLIAEAVEAARGADVALVVVGTNSQVESEGFDRTSLALPGRQDELVAAVAAANPRTVVLVNSGSPVLMPWRDDVAAVLVGWFGGQEFGNAVASVLLGDAEPGGRLTTTWPAREEDVPVLSTTPVDGVLAYDEGIHIGYRAWLRKGVQPAYWFGTGQGYTTIEVRGAEVAPQLAVGGTAEIRVSVENTGGRDGKQVVQVYAEKTDSAVERPVRWLVGSAPVRVPAGATSEVVVPVPARLLAHWESGWQYEEGSYRLLIGTSVVDLPLSAEIVLTGQQ